MHWVLRQPVFNEAVSDRFSPARTKTGWVQLGPGRPEDAVRVRPLQQKMKFLRVAAHAFARASTRVSWTRTAVWPYATVCPTHRNRICTARRVASHAPQSARERVLDDSRNRVTSGKATEAAYHASQQVGTLDPGGVVVLEPFQAVDSWGGVSPQRPRTTGAPTPGTRVSATRRGKPNARLATVDDLPPQPPLQVFRQRVMRKIKLQVKAPCGD